MLSTPVTRARQAAACAVLALGTALAAGCGASGQAPGKAYSDPAVTRVSAQMRTETGQSTQSLSRGAAQRHAGEVVELGAAFVACHRGSAQLRHSRTIAVRPSQRMSMPVLAARMVAAMLEAGWRVRSVSMTSMHIPAGAAPHPLYYVSRASTTGAVNVIPYTSTGAEAVVFINSPCFDAGPLYQTLQHEG